MEAGGHDASIVRRKDSVGGQLAVSFLIQSRAPASGMVLCLFRAVLGNFQHLEESGKKPFLPLHLLRQPVLFIPAPWTLGVKSERTHTHHQLGTRTTFYFYLFSELSFYEINL